MRLLDGATGRTDGLGPLPGPAPGVRSDGLAPGRRRPDLDGDGTRDVVAVSRFDGPAHYLEALTTSTSMRSPARTAIRSGGGTAEFKVSDGASPHDLAAALWGGGPTARRCSWFR